MKLSFRITAIILLFSLNCFGQDNLKDFNNDLVSIVVKYANGNVTQIYLPDDSETEFYETEIKNTIPILVQKLLDLGFTIDTSKSKIFRVECNSISMEFVLRRDDCYCTVYRVYENTKREGVYKIRENIDCKK